MTRKKAIEIIKREFAMDEDVEKLYPEVVEARDMAISALEQMPTKDEQALLQKWRDNRGVSMADFEDAMNALQDTCEDAISREDVLNLAKKGVLVSNGNYESVCKAINELPSVQPTWIENSKGERIALDKVSADKAVKILDILGK